MIGLLSLSTRMLAGVVAMLSSTDGWLWDPFNFHNGQIRANLFANILETTPQKVKNLDGALFVRNLVAPIILCGFPMDHRCTFDVSTQDLHPTPEPAS